MIYYVVFDVQKNRRSHYFILNTFASNAKEAKEKAKEMWAAKGNTSHQFHLYAHRSGIQDARNIRIRSFTGDDLRGYDAMDRFICTDIYAWSKRS